MCAMRMLVFQTLRGRTNDRPHASIHEMSRGNALRHNAIWWGGGTSDQSRMTLNNCVDQTLTPQEDDEQQRYLRLAWPRRKRRRPPRHPCQPPNVCQFGRGLCRIGRPLWYPGGNLPALPTPTRQIKGRPPNLSPLGLGSWAEKNRCPGTVRRQARE